ncbi:GNAT family N-acetyltransferase [Fodinicola acaciae]|uniref:GNAT family N-acetyltransferase n=1 Tax=Fodinicola acaciae TaxID=2681555 RepID=UPI0013D76BAE|nr:GNAT family N-acetyltransferase [Fodinicola acaciae]
MSDNDEIVLRQWREDEIEAGLRFLTDQFLGTWHDESVGLEQLVFESERFIVMADGDDIVGTAGAYSREVTVPGGAGVPVAAVTGVGVSPTHRRRGLLRRMMTHQLHDVHDRGREPLAALWAAESVIYGRFGYGMAIRRSLVKAAVRDIPLRADLRPEPAGRFRRLDPADAVADMAAVYEQARGTRVGFLDRPGNWWKVKIWDPEWERGGASPFRVAVWSVGKRPQAYALYRVKDDETRVGPEGILRIEELIGVSAAAELAMWDFMTSLDLVRHVEMTNAPLDFPVMHAVTDARRVSIGTGDTIWVRLVDLDRALTARTYSAPVDVVLDVTDPVCPWNVGSWRLRAEAGKPATCERTDAAADLSLSVGELGAAYLGGTSLATLAAAGRVVEQRPGALREASIAFLEPNPPFCNDFF